MVLGVRILQPPLNINGYENWYIGLVAIWCADWVKSSSRVHTETYWLVSTDKGTYSIQPSGVWAYPQAAGMLKADSTYTIKVEGPHMPLFGEYGRITKVTKHDH